MRSRVDKSALQNVLIRTRMYIGIWAPFYLTFYNDQNICIENVYIFV